MKRLLLALALITISAICYAQPQYPINQTIGAPTTLVTSRGGFRADSSLIIPTYLDTTKANISPYGKNYAGAIIRVGDSVYMRNATATKWINISQSGGGGGNSWLIGGNINPLPPYIGTKDEKELDFITFDTVRMRMPSNGIKRLQGGARKYLLYDTTTKYVYYGDAQTTTYTPTIVPYADGAGVLTGALADLVYSSNTLKIGSTNGIGTQNALELNNNRATIYGNFNGMRINVGSGTTGPIDASKEISFWNKGARYAFFGSNAPGGVGNHWLKLDSADLYLPRVAGAADSIAVIEAITGKVKPKAIPYIDSLKRNPGTDSVFARKNGQWVFQYKDSIGGGGGSTPSLQQVTDVDSVTTNNIYVNQINYYDSLVAPQHTVKTKALDGGFYVYSNIFNSNLFYVDAYDGFKSYNTTTNSISSFKNGNVTGTKEYYLPDTSGTLALKEYTIDSLKRNPGTDSVFAQKNGQWVFQYRDSVGVSGGGGGGGKIYYFNGGVNLGTFGGITMYELGDTAITGTAANFTRATTGNIANFITDVNRPGLLQIPAGVWTIDAYFSETGGGSNNAEIYAILEKWNGSTLTVIATSPIEQLTNGNVKDLYNFAISVPTTTLSITDRIVIQFYIQNTNGKTVTLYTQNGNVGEVHTTFTTGIGALNGLTAPTQTFAVGTSGTDFNISSATSTHTFNLPTASATNRGALSTTDWSTFNGKIGASDTSVFQRKSVAAFTFKANNTSSTANATDQVFRDSGTLTYAGTITWTGTTAPSGATSHRYRWCQIGKQVTITISLNYASAGSALTAVKLTLPAGCPNPTNFGTLTAANDIIGSAWAFLGTSTTAATTSRVLLQNNAGNNGYEFNISSSSGNYRTAGFTLTYFTD